MWATVGLLVASSALCGHCLLVENAYGTTGSSSNCQLTYEEIPTQKCTPEPAESCVIVDFPSEDVEYKRVCKDVTSVHCPTTRRSKREAEAVPTVARCPALVLSMAVGFQHQIPTFVPVPECCASPLPCFNCHFSLPRQLQAPGYPSVRGCLATSTVDNHSRLGFNPTRLFNQY